MPLKRKGENFLLKWYKEQYGPEADKGSAPPIPPPYPPPLPISKQLYGKVLHIDGNPKYLSASLIVYEKFNVPVIGISLEEKDQPSSVLHLLQQHLPNILVVTGHDALNKQHITSLNLNDYKHSKYFIESVRIARTYCPSYDQLVIIAGGCRSYYEALIEAGANFASSPGRILINITDPAYIACKIATTPIREFVPAGIISKDIVCGLDAFGGIETRGQCRLLEPGF